MREQAPDPARQFLIACRMQNKVCARPCLNLQTSGARSESADASARNFVLLQPLGGICGGLSGGRRREPPKQTVLPLEVNSGLLNFRMLGLEPLNQLIIGSDLAPIRQLTPGKRFPVHTAWHTRKGLVVSEGKVDQRSHGLIRMQPNHDGTRFQHRQRFGCIQDLLSICTGHQ